MSNLSLFGKWQEICADVQLRKYCEKLGLLGIHQHGFRRSRSTTMALLTAAIRWRENKVRRIKQGALFFDLSATYDVLDIYIFLEKAKICGIEGTALQWLRSYLSGQSQIVQVGQSFSDELLLSSGTPQGSSCSCLVFILFIGDLALWIEDGLLEAYADDVFITVEAESESELLAKLEEAGANILRYFASNRLVANAAKTALVVFGTGRREPL